MRKAAGRHDADPAAGLRLLLTLVNEALDRRDMRPALAVAGTGTMAMSTLDASAPTRPRRGGAPTLGRVPIRPDGLSEDAAESWALVERAQTGDGEAFGQLYDRYVDTVYRFIYFRLNDRALAEDFTSETFLRALRRLSTFSYQGRDIGAWFITIARNIILDHVKSARHRLETPTAEIVEGTEQAPSPETAVIDALTAQRLLAAVQSLGPEQRDCIVLRFIDGFSISETAAVLGKNDGAVKALQHRAVRKLAELLRDELR
jgi:RNA polymerase sigma-70 factor (ECF subfamily)